MDMFKLIEQACIEQSLKTVITFHIDQSKTWLPWRDFEDSYKDAYEYILRHFMVEPTTTLELHLARTIQRRK